MLGDMKQFECVKCHLQISSQSHIIIYERTVRWSPMNTIFIPPVHPFTQQYLWFDVSLHTANNYVTPTIHLPMSHFRVQEIDQIVVRAEIRSPTAYAFGSWHHGNISYIDAIEEDPFCNSDVEVSIVLYIFIVQFNNYPIRKTIWNTWIDIAIRELVDSLCRDGANMIRPLFHTELPTTPKQDNYIPQTTCINPSVHFILSGYACCYCCMQLSLVCIQFILVVVLTLNSELSVWSYHNLCTTQVIAIFFL